MEEFVDEAGNVWIAQVDAQGNPIPGTERPAGQRGRVIDTRAPEDAYNAPQARVNVDKTVTDIQDTREDNSRDDAKLVAELYGQGLRLTGQIDPRTGKPEIEPIPGWKDPKGSDKAESDSARSARELLRLIDGEGGLQRQFDENFAGGGVGALGEYTWGGLNQSEAVQTFTSKANSALPYVKKFMRTPGEGAQSDKDAQVYTDLLPSPNVRDGVNLQRIADMRQAALSVLESEGVDISRYDPAVGGFKPEREGSVWDQTYFGHGQGPGLADPNATEKSTELPAEYQERYDAFVTRGGFTPEEYEDFRTALDKEFFPNAAMQRETYLGEGQRILEQMERGGTINTKIGGPTVTMSKQEQQINKDAQGTLGSTFIGLANGLTSGGLEGLEYEKMQLARENAPYATLAGEALGALATTGGIGAAGRYGASRLAPSLLGGGGRGQFVRNGLTDVGYGATYGQMTEGDPLKGALYAGIGSAGGQAVGSMAGRAIGGVDLSEPMRLLRDKGVNLMPGQAMQNNGIVGRTLNRMEEASESILGLGQMIRSRREDTFRDFNRAAFNDAAAPVGGTVGRIGAEGVEEAKGVYTKAFDDTFSGVNITPDTPYMQDVNDAVFRGSQGKFGDDFNRIMDDDIAPIYNANGGLTGRGVQDMLEVTGDQARYYDDLAQGRINGGVREPQARAQSGAFRSISEGTEGLVNRQAPQVMPDYAKAREAFRRTQILKDSVHKARNGSRSGEVEVFTPSQLSDAAASNAKKFGNAHGTTSVPFRDLTKAGQEALPSSLPNSGTFDRAIAAGMSGVPIAGSIYAANEGWISPEMAAAAALLSGAYSRTGQKAINKALFDRPEAARTLGKNVRRRKGLFGSAAVVPAITIE